MQHYLKTFQGVGGLVFGNNEQTFREDDGGVERLLERIKNGVLAEDRRRAMEELQDTVAESRSAQLALGATGLPIVLSVLREERGDLDLVRGALETLVNALGLEGSSDGIGGQVQPGVLNSELLAREDGSASLLLNLLDEEDFYVRYHTLCLLTMLSRNSSVRLQEAVLATPQGLTRLMDMLQDREVIRNEALLLLTFLTRSAEEIQKIAVFEGVFEKLFNIIVEEGGSDGGIVVQDCLDLLNNILRGSAANQSFLRETLGLQPVASLLKIRKSSSLIFSQQKTRNLLCILETVRLLLVRDPAKGRMKDANVTSNQTLLMQNNVLDHLLNLSVEGRVPAVAVRCASLRCIGGLVLGDSRNAKLLWERTIGEEVSGEPVLLAILCLVLNTSNRAEWLSAEYVIRCFCEGNPEGQLMLASTVVQSIVPESNESRLPGTKKNIPFGSMLLHALDTSKGQNDSELPCRAGRVLTLILEDNTKCKEKVLQTSEVSNSPLVPPGNVLSRCVRCLVAATVQISHPSKSHQKRTLCLQAVMLRLLVTWLANCPKAVTSFLEPPEHLPIAVGLLTCDDSPVSACVKGLAAVLLGECILYNMCENGRHSASMVVDFVSQQVGLACLFEKWEELQKDTIFASTAIKLEEAKPLTELPDKKDEFRDGLGAEIDDDSSELEFQSMLNEFHNAEFVKQILNLHPLVKEKTLQLFSNFKSKIDLPAFIERSEGEADGEYIGRLEKLFQKQAMEIKDLVASNAKLAEELLDRTETKDLQGGRSGSAGEPQMTSGSRVELETLKQKVQSYQHEIEQMEREQREKGREVLYYKQLAEKHEEDLKSLAAAYNSLEQENLRLDVQVQNLRKGAEGSTIAVPSVDELEAAREKGRQDAAKESEAELNDLLVCLGQEESKVERLRARLEELGEDVEALIQGIGEDYEGEQDGAEE